MCLPDATRDIEKAERGARRRGDESATDRERERRERLLGMCAPCGRPRASGFRFAGLRPLGRGRIPGPYRFAGFGSVLSVVLSL